MKSLFSFLAAALLAATAWGQAAVPPPQDPQVQVYEVLRRGDLVTVMGEGPRSAADDAFAAAVAPPADDSALWSVTVWTTPGCPACEKLKSDFRKAPELLAFVAAPAPALPWAHYVEYSGADETQKDRRDKYRVTRYPTIVVQPPRNKMWGEPGLVVFYDNAGYTEPKGLAAQITKAVRKFAEVQAKKGYPKLAFHPANQSGPAQLLEPVWDLRTTSAFPSGGIEGAGQVAGVNPPFQTPAKPDPFNPNAVPSQSAPTQWPPTDQTAGPNLLQLVTLIFQLFGIVLPSGSTLTAILMLVLVGLKVWEVRAKQTPSTWDDKAIAVVRSLIDRTKNQDPPAPGPTPSATP